MTRQRRPYRPLLERLEQLLAPNAIWASAAPRPAEADLLVAAVMSLAPGPRADGADGDVIRQRAGDMGVWRVARPRTTTSPPGMRSGYFSYMNAYAADRIFLPGGGMLQDEQQRRFYGGFGSPIPSGAYVQGFTWATGHAQAALPGGRFRADAKASAAVLSVTANPPEARWQPRGSFAGVTINRDVAPRDEEGWAHWYVRDPATFDAAAGERFEVSWSPGAELGWHFPDPKDIGPYQALVNVSGSAGTDLPGFEHLFTWSVNMAVGPDCAWPVRADVSFSSNPALGLDDGAIAAALRSRYDGGSFDPGGFSVAASFTTESPPDGGLLTFSTEQSASVLPHPACGVHVKKSPP